MNAVLPTIDARRAEALEAFRVKGVPHRRIEEWKYSDLRSALDDGQVEHAGFAAWDIDALPIGVELFDLAKLADGAPDWVTENLGSISVHGAMDSASLAFDVGGLALRVSQSVAEPVRLKFSTHGNARLLIVLADDASLTLVESHPAGETGLRNIGAEFVLGNGARLDHIRVAETSEAVQIGTVAILVEASAAYHGHYTSFGAKLLRVDANIVLNGEGAEAHLSGVDVLTDALHSDVTTHMDHSFGNTLSTQLFKKVAGGKSNSIYQGKVTVRPGANGADSRQTAKGLLLSDRAEIDLKPELEIFADDVKCAHGAAVGDLDTDSLFYLRARGIPDAEARNMLVHAFLADALEGIANENIRAEVWAQVEARADGGCMNAPVSIKTFDAEAARADFEILSHKVYGKPLVYLDSGASAQKPRQVLDAMNTFATSEYANVHRGVHYLSAKATERYEAARETVRKFFNAAHASEIVFTKGGTEAINLVAHSWAMPLIQPGDEIVLSVMEHHSNIVPWHFLRERLGAVLRWVDVRDDGALDAEAVDAAINSKTRLVAISHMSNVLGTISPLKEIVKRAHAKGVPVLADGCQGAVHMPIDVRDLDIDFYAFTGHKLYGPTGIGALYAKREHLKAMRPFNGGGEMIQEVTKDFVTYAEPPMRFEAGTPPIIESVGLAAAIDYVNSFDREAVAAHEHDLLAYARDAVRQFNWLRVIGDAPGKGAILSFDTDGMHAHDLATILDREGVAVRAGHHCAQPLMERFGAASTTRASFALYNTRSDVDALISALAKARTILV